MQFGNVLESTEESLSVKQSSIKIDFLQKQKVRLEHLVQELKSQNQKLLQQIQQNYSKDQSIVSLTEINKKLSNEKLELFSLNEKYIAQVFLVEQINQENENEARQYMKTYQDKIIQLRKLVQDKETVIQDLQSKNKSAGISEYIVVPPYKVSLHYFTEMEELKDSFQIVIKRNKELERLNQQLQDQNQNLIMKIQTLDALIRSENSNQNKKTNYKNLKDDQVKTVHPSYPKKKLSYQSSSKIQHLYQILKKKCFEMDKLKEANVDLREKYKQKQVINDLLSQSNKNLSEKIQRMTQEIQEYKKESNDHFLDVSVIGKDFSKEIKQGRFKLSGQETTGIEIQEFI